MGVYPVAEGFRRQFCLEGPFPTLALTLIGWLLELCLEVLLPPLDRFLGPSQHRITPRAGARAREGSGWGAPSWLQVREAWEHPEVNGGVTVTVTVMVTVMVRASEPPF
jgi:hypothetical protein